MELHRCWMQEPRYQSEGQWGLRIDHEHFVPDPWKAYITHPQLDGTRKLYVWEHPSWEFYCESKNLRALKAIGRMEAARRLHV